jgi:hypothetical protein
MRVGRPDYRYYAMGGRAGGQTITTTTTTKKVPVSFVRDPSEVESTTGVRTLRYIYTCININYNARSRTGQAAEMTAAYVVVVVVITTAHDDFRSFVVIFSVFVVPGPRLPDDSAYIIRPFSHTHRFYRRQISIGY